MELKKILDWTIENTDTRPIERLNVLCLMDLMKEQIKLADVDASTKASPELLGKIREAAERISQKKCPF